MPLPALRSTARRLLAAGALAIVVLGIALVYTRPWGSALPVLPDGQPLEVAQLEALARLPPFHLERAAVPLGEGDLHGSWTFVYFGYTSCPDACPTTLGILGHVQDALRGKSLAVPRVLFISVDPARDTPAVLQRYAAAFGDRVTGATGDEAALAPLLAFFGVTYERHATAGGETTFDHTANVFLLTPDGRWLATFPPGDNPDEMVVDMQRLLQLPLP